MNYSRKSNACINKNKINMNNRTEQGNFQEPLSNDERSKQCNSTNLNLNIQIQPKTCKELWDRCGILCSSINPLDRIKYHKNGCCIVSPIPTAADNYKSNSELKFSKRTIFSYCHHVVEVDQRCTCMKFNGIEEKCKHPDCKNNWKCLNKPSPLCIPAENWKKYYEQI